MGINKGLSLHPSTSPPPPANLQKFCLVPSLFGAVVRIRRYCRQRNWRRWTKEFFSRTETIVQVQRPGFFLP